MKIDNHLFADVRIQGNKIGLYYHTDATSVNKIVLGYLDNNNIPRDVLAFFLSNATVQSYIDSNIKALLPESITTKSASCTLDYEDSIVLADGTFTIYLKTAVGKDGKKYQIKNVGSGIITVDAYEDEEIDEDTTAILFNQYECMSIVAKNGNWYII